MHDWKKLNSIRVIDLHSTTTLELFYELSCETQKKNPHINPRSSKSTFCRAGGRGRKIRPWSADHEQKWSVDVGVQNGRSMVDNWSITGRPLLVDQSRPTIREFYFFLHVVWHAITWSPHGYSRHQACRHDLVIISFFISHLVRIFRHPTRSIWYSPRSDM